MVAEEAAVGLPAVRPAVALHLDRDLIRTCIQCGMCLTACPTFRLTGSELDSPRGRIFQMKLVERGEVAATDAQFRQHIDFCLGCRACESVCPSGVRYGRLFEQARAEAQAARPRGLLWRVAFGVLFPSPRLLRLAGAFIRFYQKSGLQAALRRSRFLALVPPLRRVDSLLPRLEGGLLAARVPARTEASGPVRYRVGLLTGCVMSELFAGTNGATVRVLARNGCTVEAPPGQRCCGALHAHTGDLEGARRLAQKNVAAFEPLDLDAVLVNAAGCGSTMKEYGELLVGSEWEGRARRFAARVRDVQEFLAEVGLRARPGPLPLRVTYQDACHLAHGQGVREQPRALLRSIPGLELVEMEGADHCCGSAGVYNVTQYEAARQIGEQKLDAIAATGAPVVAAANPGCLLQIAAGAQRRRLSLEVLHPMTLLDRAYAAGEEAPTAAEAGAVAPAGQGEPGGP